MGWMSGVLVRRDLLGFVNPDFSCCELERGRHQWTYAFFSLNFTLGRGGTHLLSQMVPNPQLLSALPTFPLPGGCLGTSVPTSWAPGLPSSLCGGAPLIRSHSQLPTHTSQVSWKECGGSWAGDHKTETPRTRSQVRKRLPERRSLGGRWLAKKPAQNDSACSSVGCSVHCPRKQIPPVGLSPWGGGRIRNMQWQGGGPSPAKGPVPGSAGSARLSRMN